MPTSSPSSNWATTYALLFLMPVFMSSNIIIAKPAIESTEPWTLAFFRWGLASLLLLPFTFRELKACLPVILKNLKLLSFMAFLAMWVCGAIVYLALKETSATNGTLIYSAAPALILTLEWLFRGRKVAFREFIGIGLAITGVFVIVTKGSLNNLLSLQLNKGDLLFALCTLSWAIYSVLIKKSQLQSISTVPLFAVLSILGTILLAPFALGEMAMTASIPATSEVWLSIAGVALIASIASFLSYQYSIKLVGPSIAGMFMYLMTPYGVGMAVLFLGEKLQMFHYLGFLPIMAGLLLATLPSMVFKKTARA
ncbi:putative DMT superfamily transporter inner membrane protein [Pseudovibrio axinellae]|uniref:Putative DMT superfamily transporter inner membrane protein n=1 Tax=Pseudovibrio axinellae TaxID=989403 RepID=A0A165SVE3_9HYPH|nr:DMT family transporter [Pseudovibrio axinellae]KZL04521.1 putative DMT superfamily transporter inner membrane protein [Pseudovibrio axinellae]SER31411.1 EamA domain-containing membrane protein RarD [Pseudovibrio axinellae]